MAIQQEIGNLGEEIAVNFLIANDHIILETNWRYSRAEVDIICMKNEVLIFVEVKTRSYNYFGQPEDFITAKKQKLMSTAASAYMQKIKHEWQIRFDVISILYSNKTDYQIKHFEDAFFPGL